MRGRWLAATTFSRCSIAERRQLLRLLAILLGIRALALLQDGDSLRVQDAALQDLLMHGQRALGILFLETLDELCRFVDGAA